MPPENLYILLPNDEGYLHPLGEGFGGSYMHNEVGANWDPIFREEPCPCGADYFPWISNGSALTVAPVHHIAHATLNGFLSDWWALEGVAVYYQIEMLRRIGIISNDEMTREFQAHLKCYQDKIVGSEYDFPLKDFQAFTHSDFVTKMIAYIKGALAFYTINEIVKTSTAEKYELIDFFSMLFPKFKDGHDTSYSTFIEALNNLTGRDFQEFFEKFIFSNEPLPLEIDGDDIFLTYMPPGPPVADVKINGKDTPAVLPTGTPTIVTVELHASDYAGKSADWWIAAHTPFGSPGDWYTYVGGKGWMPGINSYAQAGLFDLNRSRVLNMRLPVGNYTFYFALDDPDGKATGPWWAIDSVAVSVEK